MLRKPPIQEKFNAHDESHLRFLKASNAIIKEFKIKKKKLAPIHFEKDEDSHLEWIVSCSILLSKCYGIFHNGEREFVRRVAGQIIPAIITTTSMVSGFMCLNLFKYVQTGYKNLSNLDFNTASNGYSFHHCVQKLKSPVPGKLISNFETVSDFVIYPSTTITEWVDFVKSKYEIGVEKITIYPKFDVYDFGSLPWGET